VYRPATDRESHLWSFGAIKAPRDKGAASSQAQRGTLDDQCIFGPMRDFHCACGKYQGDRYRGMICDWCGVKVTTREARRERFGHIDLPLTISHPLGEAGEKLSAVPVLPAAFWQAPAGSPLAQAYDDMARAVSSGVCGALAAGRPDLPDWAPDRAVALLAVELTRVIELLLPVATVAFEWDLADGYTLARGLALERREDGA
jgi:hypothetical protein